MDIINSFRKGKTVFNEKQFEENERAQQRVTPLILGMMRDLGEYDPAEIVLDFFYHTDEQSKAEDLTLELRKRDYNVEVKRTKKGKLPFFITGRTNPIINHDDIVLGWSKNMNELGYIHDCKFDGWGLMGLRPSCD